ncbi:hypothetical protein [Fodinibius halophilus]|uniref:Uncharacterized protein n=1 Tax=Fodinibius halophilus TaxID=1736908 RepID=A0A6M1T7S9_9BACT|nr:hypothetical protein [Fodinibius halophilus]NGP90119.1 hypothetical protein [Fodinibius halophilus]
MANTTDSNQSSGSICPDATISEITNTNKQAAELLASIGLSLSKHENETLRTVCEKQQWSEVDVLEWMESHRAIATTRQIPVPGDGQSLEKLGRYMERNFIKPSSTILDEIDENFPQVIQKHTAQYPWLKDIKKEFDPFKETLRMYYSFQKKKFLPLAVRLNEGRKANISHSIVRNLRRSFSILAKDRDRLQRSVNTIRREGKQFQIIDNSCAILRMQNKNFKILFGKIERQFEFEEEQLIPRIKKEIKAKE